MRNSRSVISTSDESDSLDQNTVRITQDDAWLVKVFIPDVSNIALDDLRTEETYLSATGYDSEKKPGTGQGENAGGSGDDAVEALSGSDLGEDTDLEEPPARYKVYSYGEATEDGSPVGKEDWVTYGWGDKSSGFNNEQHDRVATDEHVYEVTYPEAWGAGESPYGLNTYRVQNRRIGIINVEITKE